MNIPESIENFVRSLTPPADQTFGAAVLPVFFAARFEKGQWQEAGLYREEDLRVPVSAKTIQYAQSVFEGMKAYKVEQPTPQISRPSDHWRRFNRSAARMAIPDLPSALFMEGIETVTRLFENLIPRQPNSSLYLRPALSSDDPSLAVAPGETFIFSVHAAPTLPFSLSMTSALIERDDTRAAIGGTGAVKAAGNYASSFVSLRRAQANGCATSLWLDPLEHKYIEELTLMNFFTVINDELVTPLLTDSFLSGLTRDSILALASDLGIVFRETPIAIDDLIVDIKSGVCTELFSSGTAVVISPMRSLKEADGTEYTVGETQGALTTRLRQQLVDIQEGRAPDRHGWMHTV